MSKFAGNAAGFAFNWHDVGFCRCAGVNLVIVVLKVSTVYFTDKS